MVERMSQIAATVNPSSGANAAAAGSSRSLDTQNEESGRIASQQDVAATKSECVENCLVPDNALLSPAQIATMHKIHSPTAAGLSENKSDNSDSQANHVEKCLVPDDALLPPAQIASMYEMEKKNAKIRRDFVDCNDAPTPLQHHQDNLSLKSAADKHPLYSNKNNGIDHSNDKTRNAMVPENVATSTSAEGVRLASVEQQHITPTSAELGATPISSPLMNTNSLPWWKRNQAFVLTGLVLFIVGALVGVIVTLLTVNKTAVLEYPPAPFSAPMPIHSPTGLSENNDILNRAEITVPSHHPTISIISTEPTVSPALSAPGTPTLVPVTGGGVDCVAFTSDGFESGTFPNPPWTTGGDGKWTIDDTMAFEGTYSIKSPDLDGSETPIYSNATFITCSDFLGGVLTAQVLANVRPPWDIFVIYIDGESAAQLLDAQDFTEVSLVIPPGVHTIDFSYRYNFFGTALIAMSVRPPELLGGVWLDNVSIATIP